MKQLKDVLESVFDDVQDIQDNPFSLSEIIDLFPKDVKFSQYLGGCQYILKGYEWKVCDLVKSKNKKMLKINNIIKSDISSLVNSNKCFLVFNKIGQMINFFIYPKAFKIEWPADFKFDPNNKYTNKHPNRFGLIEFTKFVIQWDPNGGGSCRDWNIYEMPDGLCEEIMKRIGINYKKG